KFTMASSASGKYVADDIDGDAVSDIVFVQPNSNQIFGWLLDGFDLKSLALLNGGGPSGATIQGLGDTDGDGKADVLWRGSDGRFAISQLDGLTVAATTTFAYNPGRAWRVIAFGDVNGDEKADIVFYNASTSQVAVWLLNGPSIAGGGLLGSLPSATPLAVGDINGDGNRDIVWRRSNGQIWGWLLNGTSAPVSTRIGTTVVGTDWQVPVIADLDGDCMDDLIWRSRSTGMVISWKMHGLTLDAFAILHPGISTDWTIEGAPDIDGDGKREVLWRNKSTSQTAIWTMNNHASYGGGFFTSASGAWDIVKATELEMP
ncbi:MAG: VCBS repeat-containing protein, partial [Planctomycetota bacterium]|nr:VCBS repeat-containing protein [Planctomycetota bacterium]